MNKLTCTDYKDLGNVKTDFGSFLIQKWLQILELKTQNFQKRWQQRYLTSTKSYNRRISVQPIQVIEESAGHCSKILRRRTRTVLFTDTNNVEIQGWSTQTGSHGSWRCGLFKQKGMRDYVALQCRQAREFICPSPIICEKKKRIKISTNPLCEIQTWWKYKPTGFNELYWSLYMMELVLISPFEKFCRN